MFRKRIMFCVLVAIVFFYSCNADKKDSLTIAVASNLQFVMPELVLKFSEKTGIKCEIIVGSSGKLTAQIVEGAPFDLFLSADVKYPNELFDKGFTRNEPDIYAYGNLVLWTQKKGIVPELASLSSEEIKFIAVGNPKTAPYGLAAIQVLKSKKLYESVYDKIVFGESVSQTNQFIISQAADLGFTSKSVVSSTQMKHKGSWKELNKDLYDPIAQALVILNTRSKFEQDAMAFRDFMLSTEGKEILSKFGYGLTP